MLVGPLLDTLSGVASVMMIGVHHATRACIALKDSSIRLLVVRSLVTIPVSRQGSLVIFTVYVFLTSHPMWDSESTLFEYSLVLEGATALA